jgi:hypothetical protein
MAKGGQRWGAGRPGYRVKAEQIKRVDVRQLDKLGYLSRARTFSWSWSLGGESAGSIGIAVHSPNALSLQYTVTTHGEQHNINDKVHLKHAPCNLGGTRPWFSCPRCARPVAVLYMRAGRFACRHCQRVAYSSQSEGVLQRTWLKQRKLEARLGDDWRRPKGMRYATYERLIDRLHDCEARRDMAFCERVGRLFGIGRLG